MCSSPEWLWLSCQLGSILYPAQQSWIYKGADGSSLSAFPWTWSLTTLCGSALVGLMQLQLGTAVPVCLPGWCFCPSSATSECGREQDAWAALLSFWAALHTTGALRENPEQPSEHLCCCCFWSSWSPHWHHCMQTDAFVALYNSKCSMFISQSFLCINSSLPASVLCIPWWAELGCVKGWGQDGTIQLV